MSAFLKVNQGHIEQEGKKIYLHGVNLGGWLMMEGYILHSLNEAEQSFKSRFAKTLGEKAAREFEKSFGDHFIREHDFARIASMGFNCIRLPFNSRLVEQAPYRYSDDGVAYLDQAIQWAKKHGLWVILDLHAACGPQNHDWHSDSLGKAELWTNITLQKRTAALWEYLASRYADEPTVAGYDLVNEAVIDDPKRLNAFYGMVITAIRAVDKNHILFVEGNKWATDIACLDRFEDDNLSLSIHFYEPLDFTFNFVPSLRYPLEGKAGAGTFDQTMMRGRMEQYAKAAKSYGAPIFVGEFGVNYRDGYYGEHLWLSDLLEIFRSCHFHWTYWTYKAVKNNVFPDGVFSARQNPPWINRQGPRIGWDMYAALWSDHKKEIVASWETPAFAANEKIVQVLQNAAGQRK